MNHCIKLIYCLADRLTPAFSNVRLTKKSSTSEKTRTQTGKRQKQTIEFHNL